MTGNWTVWRQDDNGNRVRMRAHDDRVAALAQVLALEAGPAHRQTYWVEGPRGPVVATERDLYLRLIEAGERMQEDGRSLDAFLRAWWWAARPWSGRAALTPDEVAATILVAATAEPPALRPQWRTTSFGDGPARSGHAAWEAVVLSQIADLADFADAGPLPPDAYFGVDAPRPAGVRRATGTRWYNVHPLGYLECGTAGALGGWDEQDGLRKPVPGPVVPLAPEPLSALSTVDSGAGTVPALTWEQLTDLAVCGQEYE